MQVSGEDPALMPTDPAKHICPSSASKASRPRHSSCSLLGVCPHPSNKAVKTKIRDFRDRGEMLVFITYWGGEGKKAGSYTHGQSSAQLHASHPYTSKLCNEPKDTPRS